MTDFLVAAKHHDSPSRIEEMTRVAQALHDVTPVRSIETQGPSYMPRAGYRIILDDPGCIVTTLLYSPERVVDPVVRALDAHRAKLDAERMARETPMTTVADAAILAEVTTGRQFPTQARSITGLPLIVVGVDGTTYADGSGFLKPRAGPPRMGWSHRRITGSYGDPVARFADDVLTLKAGAEMPEALLSACTGRRVDEVVDFAPFRRQEVRVARAWIHRTKKASVLKLRVRSEAIGLHEAAKVIDRANDLRRMRGAA